MWQQQLELGEFPFPIIGIMRMGLKNWLKLGGKSGPTGFEEFKFDFEGARIPRHASVSFTLFGVSHIRRLYIARPRYNITTLSVGSPVSVPA